MEKTIKIFRSFAEAEEADKEYYRSLTSAQRIQIVLMLRKMHHSSEELAKFQRVCRVIKRSDIAEQENSLGNS